MHVFATGLAAVRRRPATGLLYLVISGLLWGTGGLTGSLLGREAGLSAIAVAAYRLTAGGLLILVFRTLAGRPWPAGRAAWTRIALVGLLAALYQSCYFTAVSLTSVPLATLVTIGTAPVLVLGADRVTGRRTGRFAAATTGLAVTSTAALMTLLEPLTGAILAAFLLGERLSATGIAGAAIIAAAVVLTVRANRGISRDLVADGAGCVGGDDGGDAQPRLPGHRLVQDHQADERSQNRVDAHEQPEVAGRNPAQREQVGQEGHGRGQDSRRGRARQRGDGRRVPDQHHDAGRHEGHRGQARRRRGSLRPGQAPADQPVEQDVAGPARGRQ